MGPAASVLVHHMAPGSMLRLAGASDCPAKPILNELYLLLVCTDAPASQHFASIALSVFGIVAT
eukprot:UN5084